MTLIKKVGWFEVDAKLRYRRVFQFLAVSYLQLFLFYYCIKFRFKQTIKFCDKNNLFADSSTLEIFLEQMINGEMIAVVSFDEASNRSVFFILVSKIV